VTFTTLGASVWLAKCRDPRLRRRDRGEILGPHECFRFGHPWRRITTDLPPPRTNLEEARDEDATLQRCRARHPSATRPFHGCASACVDCSLRRKGDLFQLIELNFERHIAPTLWPQTSWKLPAEIWRQMCNILKN
jgi:hypothetical protein